MGAEIIATVGAIAVGIITGSFAWLSKRSESEVDGLKALLEGWARRVEALEASDERRELKLQKVEQALDETKDSLVQTRMELTQERAHNQAYRRALSAALNWIADAVEWMESDMKTPPPTEPETDTWRELLSDHN